MRQESKMTAKIWRGSILLALITSVAVFMIMLQIEKKELADYELGETLVAKQWIPKGQVINENNWMEYFEIRQLDADFIPKMAINDASQIGELITLGNIDEGALLTQAMFTSPNELTNDMEDPVIAGFHAEDIYQVVGGTLRSGDRIHIYQVDEEGQTRLIWADVYVQQVFDNAGVKILCDDTKSVAQRINIYLDKMYVESFYEQLAKGTLRVVKAVG